MPEANGHGGDCCGITHISHFYNARNQAQQLEFIDQAIESYRVYFGGSNQEGRMLEIVLTDAQLENYHILRKGLKERGFKLVSRFLNSNSGNYVNVLHLRPHNRLYGSPYWKED